MKSIHYLISNSVLSVLLTIFISGCQPGTGDPPGRQAEDLWGNPLRLDRAIGSEVPTVIIPFSTSNCGYCLQDGLFTEENYIRNNEQAGGHSFHMCLFNSQMDIYTFQKHFGWTSPILTHPPALHQYHEDGFPTLLAFRNGNQLIKEFYNYAKYDTLKGLLWDNQVRLHPAGPLQMATRMIYENESFDAVMIFPPGREIPDEETVHGRKWSAYTCIHADRMTEEDVQKHLFLRSGPDVGWLKSFFAGMEIPLTFDSGTFRIGEYHFRTDSTAFYGWFPSPFHPEKYIVLSISSDYARNRRQNNYLDYLVYTGNSPESARWLLYGHYAKSPGGQIIFSAGRSFSEVDPETYCERRCLPPGPKQIRMLETPDVTVAHSREGHRETWTLGNGKCRFPDIAAGDGGLCRVVWEEDGNILTARVVSGRKPMVYFAEHDDRDSYHPKVVADGNDDRIIYLSRMEGYYRLCYRSFDGSRFTDEVTLTGKMPVDVVTPEAAGDGRSHVTVAWCEWKANYRYLYYATLGNGIAGKAHEIFVAPPVYIDEYTNAWCPSLAYASDGAVWSAWNQHYPAGFGVFGGPLSDTALPVTRTAEKMDDRENGLYPDIFTDGTKMYVVWESSAWEVYYSGAQQEIKISEFDHEYHRWAPGRVITLPGVTQLNQTPAGVCDPEGNKYVVWSGRSITERTPWGIYLTVEKDGQWSDPELISRHGENARHPKITISADDHLWISWHSGTGTDMKVRLVRMPASGL
ncbi:MAG: hypothetical protein JW861_14230 [Bacteroidales bacterium]|nr:hypothetical protein [Bacteroidales bacterium]